MLPAPVSCMSGFLRPPSTQILACKDAKWKHPSIATEISGNAPFDEVPVGKVAAIGGRAREANLRGVSMTTQSALTSERARVASVSRDATVMEAVRLMVDHRVGAVVVLDRGKLAGILSEHDVVSRLVLMRLDPETTRVGEVMRTSFPTVRDDADRSSILRVMSEHHIQHLPVLDAQGQVVTMFTLRHLLRAEVSDLKQTVWELVAEKLPDGPGG